LDTSVFQQQLEDTVQKNPKFFHHMPVIIDLQKVYSLDNDINFKEINSLLRKNSLVPVGIIHANQRHTALAIEEGLGILPNVKTTQAPKSVKKNEQSKVIVQPVRSGQQIYAKDRDLIILNSVSNGAEILADGNIHVYGTLRGRAIAGANGDTSARIFCHKLEAELISIAGHYKVQEDMATENHDSSTQIFLENDTLVIAPII
jgi:septum site-determining protein MinC